MPVMIQPISYVCKCEHPGEQHDPLTGRCLAILRARDTGLIIRCQCEKFDFSEAWTGKQNQGRKVI